MDHENRVHVRYMVDDVQASVDFYTRMFDFEVQMNAAPAFASVVRGNLRLLLAGPESSAGRPMSDGEQPRPGGWNRIHFVVDDLDDEITRLEGLGGKFRNEMIEGPGGKQILLVDPAGNFVELFEQAWS